MSDDAKDIQHLADDLSTIRTKADLLQRYLEDVSHNRHASKKRIDGYISAYSDADFQSENRATILTGLKAKLSEEIRKLHEGRLMKLQRADSPNVREVATLVRSHRNQLIKVRDGLDKVPIASVADAKRVISGLYDTFLRDLDAKLTEEIVLLRKIDEGAAA